jgi:hypothetical protein
MLGFCCVYSFVGPYISITIWCLFSLGPVVGYKRGARPAGCKQAPSSASYQFLLPQNGRLGPPVEHNKASRVHDFGGDRHHCRNLGALEDTDPHSQFWLDDACEFTFLFGMFAV